MPRTIETLLETRKFSVVRLKETTPGGRQIERECIHHPGAVTILPMVDDEHVCLIRNYRATVGETLIELPAGMLDPGEDPLDTARRELIEETGYRSGRIEKMSEFFLSPGILDERMFLYAAYDLTPGEPAREATEEIENLVVPWAEAMRLVEAGTIRDAKSLVGLLAYDRLRQ